MMLKHKCPICQGQDFTVFNGRPNARCVTCGSLERGRYQWLVLQKFVNIPAGAVIAHFAPEAFLIEHFSKRNDIEYNAYDKYPEFYSNSKVTVTALDLCEDLGTLKAGSVDLIIHSHVLEHLPCVPDMVLHQMKQILKPGGMMLFSVPIHGQYSVEGIDPAGNDEEREMRARQGEHMRTFGRIDFQSLLSRMLGADNCLIRQLDHFDVAALEEANIPIIHGREPTGISVFLYRKES